MPIEEAGKKPGAKDLFNLVKKSPALLITGIAGVLVVGYILVKKSGATVPSTATTDGTTLPATVTPGGYYQPQQSYIQPVVPTTPSIPVPVTTPTISTPGATIPSLAQDDIVRTRYGNPAVKSYDTTHPQGIPIRSAPAANANDTTGYRGYGTKIQVVGPAVAGSSNLGGSNGTNFWYPIAGGGYVSAFDLQSSFPAANSIATVPSSSN